MKNILTITSAFLLCVGVSITPLSASDEGIEQQPTHQTTLNPNSTFNHHYIYSSRIDYSNTTIPPQTTYNHDYDNSGKAIAQAHSHILQTHTVNTQTSIELIPFLQEKKEQQPTHQTALNIHYADTFAQICNDLEMPGAQISTQELHEIQVFIGRLRLPKTQEKQHLHNRFNETV